MNPDNHFNLPPPVAESQSPAPAEVAGSESDAEQLHVANLEAAGNRVATPPPAMLSQAAQQAIADLQASAGQQTATEGQDQPATSVQDNSQPLEKVWVIKAKQIVNQTMNDPYEQQKQLAAVKADFIQTHYGKTVKLAE